MNPRIFTVKKIIDLSKECGRHKDFMKSKWISVDDIFSMIENGDLQEGLADLISLIDRKKYEELIQEGDI